MMRVKKITFTNFSHANYSESSCLRPDNERQLLEYLVKNKPSGMLARGSGLSYSDSCLNKNGLIIDMQRFNHLIEFDSTTGIAVCQGGVLINDLFLLHPEFIPAVIPGTVHATVAGGIAHDVHGKNNHHAGSFGHHIVWIDLLVKDKIIRCSRDRQDDLFYATIGGLGLTGIIIKAAIRLKRKSRFVQVENTQFNSIRTLTETMSTHGLNYEYQVAWLDLLHSEPRAILSLASHCSPFPYKKEKIHSVPRFPMRVISSWNMKWFNKLFFNSKKPFEKLILEEFNNPLDKMLHWNRLYGPKGLIQFQAVFKQEHAGEMIEQLISLIRQHQATPTLAVLKLFIQTGEGLLSFCNPGFTIAIDFINNAKAREAVLAMNQFITGNKGRVYLAKDLLLTPEQYQSMYPNYQPFKTLLNQYECSMQSDLSKRLGITQ